MIDTALQASSATPYLQTHLCLQVLAVPSATKQRSLLRTISICYYAEKAELHDDGRYYRSYLVVSKLEQISSKVDAYAAHHIDGSSGHPSTHFRRWT